MEETLRHLNKISELAEKIRESSQKHISNAKSQIEDIDDEDVKKYLSGALADALNGKLDVNSFLENLKKIQGNASRKTDTKH